MGPDRTGPDQTSLSPGPEAVSRCLGNLACAFATQPWGQIILSIAQKMKLRLRGVKTHVQGHTCRKGQNCDSNPGLSSFQGCILCPWALLLGQLSGLGPLWSFCTHTGQPPQKLGDRAMAPQPLKRESPPKKKERKKKGKHTHFTGNNIFPRHLTVS